MVSINYALDVFRKNNANLNKLNKGKQTNRSADRMTNCVRTALGDDNGQMLKIMVACGGGVSVNKKAFAFILQNYLQR